MLGALKLLKLWPCHMSIAGKANHLFKSPFQCNLSFVCPIAHTFALSHCFDFDCYDSVKVA